jgi:cardiolipin synthase
LVDNAIGWCGSQNASDPEFRIKARYAPWIDIMTRWEGPVVRDMQFLFVSDWLGESGEDLAHLLSEPPPVTGGPIDAQVVGTGPTRTYGAMSALFTELIHSAREELVVTTPYFVPDEPLLFALLNTARRGVRTVLVMPERNDSRIVAGASRSHFRNLLEAGVELYLFTPGLLHAKTMVVDGRIGLVGSANLDRRSIELNFENNVLFDDAELSAAIRRQQDTWIAMSRKVHLSDVMRANVFVRLWRNTLAMLAPLL